MDDYPTPKDLALYLERLDANPEEYLSYFWWRSYYRVSPADDFGRLCRHLHDKDVPTVKIPNVGKWWMEQSSPSDGVNVTSACLSGRRKLWRRYPSVFPSLSK